MDPTLLKLVHVGAVVVSIVGFAARGAGALSGADWVRARAMRVLPHVVDTVLLGSALALAWALRMSPHQQPWLAAKVVALLAYIALGMVALKPSRPRAVRAGAYAAALLCAAYIVGVAITKSPTLALSPQAAATTIATAQTPPAPAPTRG